MEDHRQPKGNHTWDIIIQYHACPQCGQIIESRFDYEYRQGQYQKDLKCKHCGRNFTAIKKIKR